MSGIANITVFDGASTPVSHTLLPISITRVKEKITAVWREGIAGLPVEAQVRMTAELSLLKSGVWECKWTVETPVMEAVTNQNAAGYTAAPKVAYEDKMILIEYAHPRSTVTSRRLNRQLGVNVSGNISTSVAAATSGPFSELFDQLVCPT